MKKIFLISLVSLLVGLGLGLLIPHGANPVGGRVRLADNFIYGLNAGTTDQLSINSSGLLTTSGGITDSGTLTQSGTATLSGTNTLSGATTISGALTASDTASLATTTITKTLTLSNTGNSSSSPAALGSGISGHFIVAADATTANASTTAVTATTDRIFVQLEQSSPIAGTTCNTTVNSSSTPAAVLPVVITATSTMNGFTVTIPSAPVTNPFCFSYQIIK